MIKSSTVNLKAKWPFVTLDSSLNGLRDRITFSKKLVIANTVLKTAKLPDNKNTK